MPPNGLRSLNARDLRGCVSCCSPKDASQPWIAEICRLVPKGREI